MKCAKCNIDKTEDNFYVKNKKTKKLHSFCKPCLYVFQKARWKERKRRAVNLMGGCCSICGYKKNLSALDFHHLEPDKKEFDWNRLKLYSWDRIISELKKCVLLCCRCHREVENPDDTIITPLDNTVGSIKSSGKCPQCDADVFGTTYCSRKCLQISRRKIIRPNKKELIILYKKYPMTQIGKMFGVSDVSIRKWMKQENIL